jgi:hypothetical protein
MQSRFQGAGCRTVRTNMHRSRLAALVLLLLSGVAYGGGGPLGIDHEWSLDQSGIWARNYQTGLENGVIAMEVAGSLWFGNDDELGHTFWQTVDASAISGIGAAILKRGFGRARPYQGDNPNLWFKGSCCESFPSGEVTLQASFVTPFIANYARQNPWVWSLEILPLYDAIARRTGRRMSSPLGRWARGSGIGARPVRPRCRFRSAQRV